jgi:hypothetical protein
VTEISGAVAAELARLRAENARLLKMLELSPRQAAPPGPARAGFFDAPPGPVLRTRPMTRRWRSSGRCSRRADIYATRIENTRSGWKGWLPAGSVEAADGFLGQAGVAHDWLDAQALRAQRLHLLIPFPCPPGQRGVRGPLAGRRGGSLLQVSRGFLACWRLLPGF